MPRRRKTTLTQLPKTKRQPKIPKPKMPKINPDPSSRSRVKLAVGINVPGVKTT